MTSWEDRMAQNQARRPVIEAAGEDHTHDGHHTHLRGSCVECSCGEFFGVTCVVIDPAFDYATLRCGVCGEPGVAGNGSNGN